VAGRSQRYTLGVIARGIGQDAAGSGRQGADCRPSTAEFERSGQLQAFRLDEDPTSGDLIEKRCVQQGRMPCMAENAFGGGLGLAPAE
jgi:hypothetical protein